MPMKLIKRGFALFLCVLLTFIMLTVGFTANAAIDSEFETVGAVNGMGSVTIKQGEKYVYQSGMDYAAFKYTISAGNGYAFCLEPEKGSPTGGAASKTFAANTISSETNEQVLKALFYGYGGPGFNVTDNRFSSGGQYSSTSKGLMDYYRNANWLTLNGDNYYYAFTHCTAAYLKYGTSGIGKILTGDWQESIKAYAEVIKKLPSVKNKMRAYIVDTGSSTQKMIFPVFKIKLKANKISSNPAFTTGNGAYSLEGAQFVVFNDITKATAAASAAQGTSARGSGRVQANSYAQTDVNGIAKFYNLGYSGNGVTETIVDNNTYYLVEFRSPMVSGKYQGFDISNIVYTFTDTGTVDSSGLPIYSVTVSNVPRLVLKLSKRSSDTSLTDNNSCYSFTGAKYGIYDSESDANSNSSLRGVITTDENGEGTYTYSQGSAIPAKEFWGKELTAPKGYALDTEAHRFTYSGQRDSDGFPIYSFESVEKPKTDPITVLLQKYDVTTGKGTNKEKLANAEFTVKFYPAYYNSVDEIGDIQPLRSWVFKTNNNGFLNYSDNYKVSGDDFFYQTIDGISKPTIPYGTITVQETKAPTGYKINPEIYLANINETNGNIFWRTTNENVDGSVLQFPETPTPSETFITKTDITGSKEVVGATLTVSESNNLSAPIDEWTSAEEPHRIVGLEKGKEYVLSEKIPADGYVTANSITFKVNEDGSPTYVTMKDDVTKIEIIKVNTNNQPVVGVELQILDNENNNVVVPTWKTDGKPYRVDGKLIVGKTYRLHEVSTLPNYTLADDVLFEVKDTSEIQPVKMVNAFSTGSVTLNKKDGNGNKLSGSQWQLFTSDKKSVLVELQSEGRYKVAESGGIQTMSTDEYGVLSVSELTPGDYFFVEVKAPNGTMPYAKEIPFTISANSVETLYYDLEVQDDKSVLNKTGSIGAYPFYSSGCVFLLSAILTISIYIKKRKTRKEVVTK